ncbi:SH3 domain-containing protein [Leptothermofonsia sp. ETS-13]|uniref:SH3 domain-containing protein n=1 Tax=Leptothermofonsia sp. ETS-13 TaxID=3035696 RepID=UPI003B9FBDBA
MSWSDLIKVLSGIFFAFVLIASGSFIAAQYVIAQFTAPPPRPTFPNDNPSPKAKPVTAAQANPAAVKPSPSPSPSPSSSETPSPQKTEASGYRARIVLSQGLNLRENPDRNAERIGGVEYNESIVILEDSPDGEWQKVRVESSGQEGWIKSGYAERAN